MSGVSTLWDLSLSLLVLFIFSLLLNMFQNGVEAKPTRTNDDKVVVDFVRSNLF